MNQQKIARPYAKAFFEVACESNLLEALKADLVLVYSHCESDSHFMEMLQSPVMRTKLKIEEFDTLFSKKVHPLTLQLLTTLTQNKREVCLPQVCFKFIELYRKKMGIKQAKVISAIPLNSALQAKFTKAIEESFHAKIELTNELNPEIIGGFIIRVDDQQIDTSLSNKLNRIKQVFLNTSV